MSGPAKSSSKQPLENITNIEPPVRPSKIFEGLLRQVHVCMQCNTITERHEHLLELDLCFTRNIPEEQAVSIQQLINGNLQPEILSGNNKYNCSTCNTFTDCMTMTELVRTPEQLIIVLKLFMFDPTKNIQGKINTRIHCPIEIMLPERSVDEQINVQYCLRSTINHSGTSLDEGHFFTYAKDIRNNWYKYNDSKVHRVQFPLCLTSFDTPYILFFERKSSV